MAESATYRVGQPVAVKFEDHSPEPNDWIGLYPWGAAYYDAGTGTTRLPHPSTDWMYLCGTKECDGTYTENVQNGDTVFANVDAGRWKVYIIRNGSGDDGYEFVAESEEFEVKGEDEDDETTTTTNTNEPTYMPTEESSVDEDQGANEADNGDANGDDDDDDEGYATDEPTPYDDSADDDVEAVSSRSSSGSKTAVPTAVPTLEPTKAGGSAAAPPPKEADGTSSEEGLEGDDDDDDDDDDAEDADTSPGANETEEEADDGTDDADEGVNHSDKEGGSISGASLAIPKTEFGADDSITITFTNPSPDELNWIGVGKADVAIDASDGTMVLPDDESYLDCCWAYGEFKI